MKFSLITISAFAILLNLAKAQTCSMSNFVAVPSVNLLGRWITYLRYDNGPQFNTKCSFYDTAINQTVSGSIIDWQSDISATNVQTHLKGDVTVTSATLTEIHVRWVNGVEMPIHITGTDSENNYIIARGCDSAGEGEYVYLLVVVFFVLVFI